MRPIGTHIRHNVIGYVAVFIALSGSAYAAGLASDSVRSRHIKDGQVKSNDVLDDSLAGSDIVESSLNGVPVGGDTVGSGQVAADSLQAVDLGPESVGFSEIATNGVGKPELAANTVGSEELLAINEVVDTKTVAPSEKLTVVATCPAGQQILTGGFSRPATNLDVVSSHRSGGGWMIEYFNPTPVPSSGSAHAYCLSA